MSSSVMGDRRVVFEVVGVEVGVGVNGGEGGLWWPRIIGAAGTSGQ